MPNRSPDEIRNDIEQTRDELGDTVEALAAKTDVKAQAHAKVEDAKAQAQAKVEEAKRQAMSKLDVAKQRVEAARGHGSHAGDPTATDGAPSPPAIDLAEKARAGAQRAQQTAADNPVPAAALGGFVGGWIVGRLMCRRH